jgi:hypothetical protein
MQILFFFVSIRTLGLPWSGIAVYARVRQKGYSPPATALVLKGNARRANTSGMTPLRPATTSDESAS